MPNSQALPLRRLAIVLLFVTGVVVSAATSAATPPTVDLGRTTGTISLDLNHPTAFAHLLLRFSAEATGSARPQVQLATTSVSPAGHVRVIASRTPPADPTPSRTISADPWQADLSAPSTATLDPRCGAGPCEREVWVIATLADATTEQGSVAWSASASVTYNTGGDYAAGASATITADPPIQLAGPAPALAAATPPEALLLTKDAPAAARIVEVRVGAAAVGPNGAPVAIGVPLSADPTTPGVVMTPGVRLYDITDLDALGGASPTPIAYTTYSGALAQSSSFTTCAVGKDCVRRFLVTFETSSGDLPYDAASTTPIAPTHWQLSVTRLDVASAWGAPATLSATVAKRYDVDTTAKPTSAHVEGDSRAGSLTVTTRTTSNDPVFGLLPVPAKMTIAAQIATGAATAPPGATTWQLTGQTQFSPSRPFGTSASPTQWSWSGNPASGWCIAGAPCVLGWTLQPMWQGKGSPPPPPETHWAVDISVFAYRDLPTTTTIR